MSALSEWAKDGMPQLQQSAREAVRLAGVIAAIKQPEKPTCVSSRGIRRRGNVWWIRYTIDKKRYAESTQSTNYEDAVALLAIREAFKSKNHHNRARDVAIRFLGLDGSPRKHRAGPVSVYVIGPVSGPYKIGVALDPRGRVAGLQTSCPAKLSCWYTRKACCRSEATRIEKATHAAFSDTRLIGEWFSAPLHEIIDVVWREWDTRACSCGSNTVRHD